MHQVCYMHHAPRWCCFSKIGFGLLPQAWHFRVSSDLLSSVPNVEARVIPGPSSQGLFSAFWLGQSCANNMALLDCTPHSFSYQHNVGTLELLWKGKVSVTGVTSVPWDRWERIIRKLAMLLCLQCLQSFTRFLSRKILMIWHSATAYMGKCAHPLVRAETPFVSAVAQTSISLHYFLRKGFHHNVIYQYNVHSYQEEIISGNWGYVSIWNVHATYWLYYKISPDNWAVFF